MQMKTTDNKATLLHSISGIVKWSWGCVSAALNQHCIYGFFILYFHLFMLHMCICWIFHTMWTLSLSITWVLPVSEEGVSTQFHQNADWLVRLPRPCSPLFTFRWVHWVSQIVTEFAWFGFKSCHTTNLDPCANADMFVCVGCSQK